MDRVVVEHYLARAAAAASVRELHALAREVRRAHAGDPDAERVEQACWTAALRVVAEPPAERAPGRQLPEPRAFANRREVRGARAEHAIDWKERAARA